MDMPLVEDCLDVLYDFIAGTVGNRDVFVGLSGGIDSAVVAGLCAGCLDPSGVHGVFMPSATTPDGDRGLTESLAASLGIGYSVVEVAPIVSAFRDALPPNDDRVIAGNLAARCRMTVLYHHANSVGGVVVGTGNKSELLQGYFTKYGDGGVDLLPLGDLYKTQVRELATLIGLPDEIVSRPPSAGFWEGQTDEGEMGVTYETLDRVLLCLERQVPIDDLAECADVDPGTARAVWDRYRSSAHKRRMPPIPKMSARTIGVDWRG